MKCIECDTSMKYQGQDSYHCSKCNVSCFVAWNLGYPKGRYHKDYGTAQAKFIGSYDPKKGKDYGSN